MTLSAWTRAIRARFLAASVIAVAIGISVSIYRGDAINIIDGALTLGGVLALHSSVDLLNDYWDHVRNIDANTTKTPYSGGTGVIQDGALSPDAVRYAGIAAMLVGLAIGAYFVIVQGPIIAAILGFAVSAVYFYSTRIVDSGLAEVFVAAKASLVVIGTSFIQSGQITDVSIVAGIAAGSLSSIVLYTTSIPDHDADKAGGRRTLIVCTTPRSAARIFWIFLILFAAIISFSVYFEILPLACLASLGPLVIGYKAGKILQLYKSYPKMAPDRTRLVSAMSYTVLYSRFAGIALVVGLIVSTL